VKEEASLFSSFVCFIKQIKFKGIKLVALLVILTGPASHRPALTNLGHNTTDL
jgi:hypothetical protein